MEKPILMIRWPEHDQHWCVETNYASASVLTKNGIVIFAAPIYNWMEGKRWIDVKDWKKITNIVLISDNTT